MLLFLLLAAQPSIVCPPGSVVKRWEEPTTLTLGCEARAENGQTVWNGPTQVWANGKLAQEGAYRQSRRAGTWTWYRPDGTRQTLVTFGDEDNTLEIISDPDQPWRRVQQFGPDQWTSKVNGERVTALGDEVHLTRYRTAPAAAVVKVLSVRDAVGVAGRESCCQVEDGRMAGARRDSVARYLLEVVGPAVKSARVVCATTEYRIDFHPGDLLIAGFLPEGEGKTDCGGGLKADGFVTALSYRQTTLPTALRKLEELRGPR